MMQRVMGRDAVQQTLRVQGAVLKKSIGDCYTYWAPRDGVWLQTWPAAMGSLVLRAVASSRCPC